MRIITIITILLLPMVFSFGQTHNHKGNTTVFGKPIQHVNSDGIIRCASTEYEQYLRELDPTRADEKEFEQWLAPKVQLMKQQLLQRSEQGVNAVVTLPVVVHVIHSGQAVGTGANISDLRVQSQITVLNQDFRRMAGTPGFNSHSVGADTEIEFCLAQRDPNGNPTNGINRVQIASSSVGESTIQGTIKPQTQWDPTQYFNIWVVQFSGGGILGYAQFPSNSGLGGLNTNGGAATTDGVVIDWRCFGTSTIAPGQYYQGYDRGRTTTHEIGHCFGLRHIWGDNPSCVVNTIDSQQDYCPDTPAANGPNDSCIYSDSCPNDPGADMKENYMDYTNDSCLNIFTIDQKARMWAVLQNSPRRNTLINSLGCVPPQTFGLDGNINIVNLNLQECGTTINPVVSLQNLGSTTLSSAIISYNVDGANPQTYNWSGTLTTGQSSNITLNTITASNGSHTFNVSITSVNGQTDENTTNNSRNQTFNIAISNSTTVSFTLQPDMYGNETTWTLKNSANTTLYSGGPYTQTAPSLGAIVQQTWNLSDNECYTFTINDTPYADGICCNYGNGYYQIKDASNVTIVSGGQFGATESKSFGVYMMSVDEHNWTSGIYLYPNPTKGLFTIKTPNENLPDAYEVFNTLGQIIFSKDVHSEADLDVNAENLSNGVYFIKVTKENTSKTIRFIKQ